MSAMMAALAVGTGLLLVWSAATAQVLPSPVQALRRTGSYRRLEEQLAVAGYRRTGIRGLVAVCATAAGMGGFIALVATQVPVLAAATAGLAAAAPVMFVRSRARAHRRLRRDAWPDAVDHVASAVRAGLSIPEALRQLAEHGPEVLRADFADFARHDAAHGRFDVSLDVLKRALADPAADRLIESLRLARNVGGTDVGRLLRTLSTFLREDAATRTELAARQSWTVSAARLALGAPWIALLIVGFRGGGLEAYRTAAGAVVLVAGGAVSGMAYLMMKSLGRLPLEDRVML